MTVTDNSLMSNYASQISNKNIQSNKSGDASDQEMKIGEGFDAIAKLLMSALDTNKNGSVDKTEFADASKILAKSQSSENVANAFNQIDTDDDSSISSNEFLNALKDLSEKKQNYKQQIDMNALSTILQSDQTSKFIQQPNLQMNETQKSLFNKITNAYTNAPTSTGTTTNISV
ncbi:MAG: EF-hand domain-containing protein [Sulfurimonas sp.]|jgi:hypothetical protein